MHYVAMMVVVAGISLYTSGGNAQFRQGYEAVTEGEFGKALGLMASGIRRALREADPEHRDFDPRAG